MTDHILTPEEAKAFDDAIAAAWVALRAAADAKWDAWSAQDATTRRVRKMAESLVPDSDLITPMMLGRIMDLERTHAQTREARKPLALAIKILKDHDFEVEARVEPARDPLPGMFSLDEFRRAFSA